MITTVYDVKGMTCGHCENAVSGEISKLAGVSEVVADHASGEVTVKSETALDAGDVAAAVEEAGYELVA